MVFSKHSIILLCIAAIVCTNAVNSEGIPTHSQHKGAPNKHVKQVKTKDTIISDLKVDIDAEALKNNDLVAEIEYDGDESMDIVLSPTEVNELMQGDELLIDIPSTESVNENHKKEKPTKVQHHQKKVKKVSPKNHNKKTKSKSVKKVTVKKHHIPLNKQVKADKEEYESNEHVKKYPYGSVTYVTKSKNDKKKETPKNKVSDTKHEAKVESTELSVQADTTEDISTKNGPTVIFAGILAAAIMTIGTVAAVVKRSHAAKESTQEKQNDVEDLDNLDQLESAKANNSMEGMKAGDSDLEETEGTFIHNAVAV